MDRVSVSRFAPPDRLEWDNFVDGARNPHFFFLRDFMEYHADRFTDYSLMIRNEAGALRAILPANRAGNVVHSHQGLSFGGLVVQTARGAELLRSIDDLCGFLAANGIERLVYKTLPSIYHLRPSEDDRYALHRLGARLARHELSSVIDLASAPRYSNGRHDQLRRARRAGISVTELANPAPVADLVATVLAARHNVGATHSQAELRRLQQSFPHNIRTFAATSANELLAGAIVFINDTVVHTQYLANADAGRACGALDYLIDRLIHDVAAGKRWFSFGISTEDGGRTLNEGLLAFKEGFGAHGIVHDTYELDL